MIRVFLLILFLAGCESTPRPEPVERPLPQTVELQLFQASGLSNARLNVSIIAFEDDHEVSGSLHNSLAQVRSVENRYVPYVLKKTLDQSAFWGAVRVMPRSDPSVEIIVKGKVLSSDGVEMIVQINVQDATGRVWIDRMYYDVTDEIDYATDPNYTRDSFQDLYNRVANDMAEFSETLSHSQVSELLDIALVKYALVLSPESFGKYLATENGLSQLSGLPARDDPVLQRIEKIRDSEYLFADSVDAHYESLYRELGQTYAWWRYYSYELIVGNERLGDKDATRGATRGSWYVMERVYKTFKESKMNEDALRELTDSFDNETASTVAEVSGRVYELNGTLDYQYNEWRRILRQVYRSETGF